MARVLTDVKAWYLDTMEPVSIEQLELLGIQAWHIDHNDSESLNNMCKKFHVDKRSQVIISKKETPDMFLKQLTAEHLHENDELRYVTEGSGYLDVRDSEDRWIRYHMQTEHFSIVPTGIYHRFLLDENVHFKALRLFNDQMSPTRKAFHRDEESTDELPARTYYIQKYLNPLKNKKVNGKLSSTA